MMTSQSEAQGPREPEEHEEHVSAKQRDENSECLTLLYKHPTSSLLQIKGLGLAAAYLKSRY
jgi:hypothetical protein